MKQRLDQLAVSRNLAESREQAKRLILAGRILVEGRAGKPGNLYAPDTRLELVAAERFVSRGGEKLAEAFRVFDLEAEGMDCLDVGASTGGFTDCLLQEGAARVVALDVGHGQLHYSLRTNPKVTVMERFNARYLCADDLPYRPSLAVTDVSFISLTLILPPMAGVLLPGGEIVALIKPQFEAGRAQVEKGGVVRDPAVREEVREKIRLFATNELALDFLGIAPSPIKGPKGNLEFLIHLRKAGA